MRAAELLSHAKVDVIAWNGTSASWLGFERDERLCERIVAATDVAACTSVLAFREIFQRTGVSRIGLVTPYVDAVQAKIVDNLERRSAFPAPASGTAAFRTILPSQRCLNATSPRWRERSHDLASKQSRLSARTCAAPSSPRPRGRTRRAGLRLDRHDPLEEPLAGRRRARLASADGAASSPIRCSGLARKGSPDDLNLELRPPVATDRGPGSGPRSWK